MDKIISISWHRIGIKVHTKPPNISVKIAQETSNYLTYFRIFPEFIFPLENLNRENNLAPA